MKLRLLFLAAAFASPCMADDAGVPWKTFAQVQLLRTKDGVTAEFSPAVAALDQKEIRVTGFMFPLEAGEKHTFFILSSVPPTCSFCMPAGPQGVLEVRAKRGFGYTEAAITLTGKLSVLKNDPTGILYRLTEAVPSK